MEKQTQYQQIHILLKTIYNIYKISDHILSYKANLDTFPRTQIIQIHFEIGNPEITRIDIQLGQLKNILLNK